MATAVMAAKKAAKEYQNRIFPPSFCNSNFSSWGIDRIKSNESDLCAQRRAITYKLANLLPVEEGRRSALNQHLETIEHLFKAFKPRRHHYPILSTEPLTWRDEQGWPKLVIMPVDLPGYVKIWGKGGTWSYQPAEGFEEYREFCENVTDTCYDDVGQKLSRSGYDEHFIEMGLGNLLLPTKVVKKIARARKFFGKQIFLVAEAGEWVEGKVVYPKPDPLVVGYEDGLLFLIAVFDLKKIEDIARSEFTTPQSQLPAKTN